jgi:hypothetical protein
MFERSIRIPLVFRLQGVGTFVDSEEFFRYEGRQGVNSCPQYSNHHGNWGPLAGIPNQSGMSRAADCLDDAQAERAS